MVTYRVGKFKDRIRIMLPGNEVLYTGRGYEWGSKDLVVEFVKDERLLKDEQLLKDSAHIFVEWLVDNMPHKVFNYLLEEIDIYREKRGS